MKQTTQSFYSVSELARVLGISRIAVFKKIKSGHIPAAKVGRAYVIKADDVSGIIGKELGQSQKQVVERAVRKVVHDYGEALKLLGRE